MWLFSSVNGMPRFSETCSAAMNCPWFLNPSDALSSVIVLPVNGSIGSSAVSFVFRFGFDAIFAAMGFSGVVSDVVVVTVVVPPWFAPFPLVVVVVVVVFDAVVVVVDGAFDGLPVAAGLPVVRAVVVVAGFDVVGL